MSTFQICNGPIRFLSLMMTCLALSGCFTSDAPLISPENADYPFESVTYIRDGSSEEITLKRGADGYIPITDSGSTDRLLLKKMSDGVYIAQTAVPNSDAQRFLYGLITVAPDRKSFTVSAGMAEESDFEAVRGGVTGLSICSDDDETICIENLQAYLNYAQVVPGSVEHHRILRMH